MIIKVTYNVTDVYMSTTSNPIYINVSYGDGGGGASVWGQITGTLSDQTDLQSALDGKFDDPTGTTSQYIRGDGSLATFPSLTGFVPYTGATTNVDLGEYELKAGQIELDQSPTGVAGVAVTRWNDTIGSTETTLKGGSVVLKNGVDLIARIVNKVTPNTTLTKAAYQAVRISGAQGQRLAVALAQANNDNNSADTIGLVTETIATNQEGFIMTVGSLEGINTTGSLQGETWVDGDVLYLSPTTAGAITNVKPVAPQHLVIIGYVEYAHQNNGKIYVKVMNGWELGELHDVNTSGATNGQVLTYNGSIWVPTTNGAGTVTSVAATGGTGISISGSPITSSGTLTITNTAPDQTVSLTQGGTTTITGTYPNFTISSVDQFTGTVTSVGALTLGTSGTDLSSSVANGTTTPVITLNVPTASATNRGALSSSDWTTFNNKQNALTFGNLSETGSSILTISGGTGAVIGSGTTIQVAQASGSTSGFLSSTDWTTFNNKQNALTNPVTGTGISGQVAYWSGTTTQTGSNNLFWDNANTRLGIGTNAPSYTLDVNGTGRVVGNFRFDVGIRDNRDNTIITQSLSSVVSNRILTIGNATYFNINFPNGNILIGTTTDGGQRLQVEGTTRLNGNVNITGSTTASSGVARNLVNPTLVAAANNDVLVGLDITPTFTNGAFTGVTNNTLRLTGSTLTDGGQLGAELTTTGSGTNWSGTGFATGYTHTVGSTVALTTTLAAVNGNYYQITYTITGRTAGSITIAYGGISISGINGSGNSGQRATATTSLTITPTTDFDGTVVLSIKAITAGTATMVLRNSAGTVTNELRSASSNTNMFQGVDSGSYITTGTNNTSFGYQSIQFNTSATNNTAFGFQALRNNTAGSGNTAIGNQALLANTTGIFNTAIGNLTLTNSSTNQFNVAVGHASLQVTTGGENTGIGAGAMTATTTGSFNVAIGTSSLNTQTTGSQNISIGRRSGRFIADGTTSLTIANNSIFIGSGTKANADNQTNQIVIGTDETGLGSNTTILGNASTVTTAIRGNLLLGTTTDAGFRLDVNGTARVQSDMTIKGSGNTSGSTALTVQNSDGNNIFRVRNDRTVFVDAISSVANFQVGASLLSDVSTTSILTISPNRYLYINTNISQNLYGVRIQNSSNITDTAAASFLLFGVGATFAPTSGTGVFNSQTIYSTINQTGGANGITRGLYVNPTLTAAADWRSIETSNNTGWAAYFAGSADIFVGDGADIQIGATNGTKIGTATSQKIGFWNATPIVQPTTAVAAAAFVANTSGIANDTATFDGYTIGQIVKALRNAGLLA